MGSHSLESTYRMTCLGNRPPATHNQAGGSNIRALIRTFIYLFTVSFQKQTTVKMVSPLGHQLMMNMIYKLLDSLPGNSRVLILCHAEILIVERDQRCVSAPPWSYVCVVSIYECFTVYEVQSGGGASLHMAFRRQIQSVMQPHATLLPAHK